MWYPPPCAVCRSIQQTRLVTPSPRRHTAIQRHTAPYSAIQRCMSIQLYSTIQHTAHTTPLSWLAAELLRAELEPGAVDRRAGWTGLCPSSPVPKVRPRPPARHAAASARAPIHPARPCAPWAILVPHCITTQYSCVPGFAQVSTRAFQQGAVRQRDVFFCVENDPLDKIFFASGGAAQAAGPLVKKPRTPPGWP